VRGVLGGRLHHRQTPAEGMQARLKERPLGAQRGPFPCFVVVEGVTIDGPPAASLRYPWLTCATAAIPPPSPPARYRTNARPSTD
jgi:hypothetical protein